MSTTEGRKSGISTSAVKLKDDPILYEEVIVFAALDNADPVYIASRSDVTADSDDGTDGFPLLPGRYDVWENVALNALFAISPSGTLKVWFKARRGTR